MKFNAEQLTEYLNMEAQYKEMGKMFREVRLDEVGEEAYENICRRYAYATIQMVKMRSFVRGPSYGVGIAGGGYGANK